MTLSLLLSAVFFVWELVGLRSAMTAAHATHDPVAAVLLYVRMIFVLICLPSLWITRLLMSLGWLPADELESPNAFQMKMFAWTLNGALTLAFFMRVLGIFVK